MLFAAIKACILLGFVSLVGLVNVFLVITGSIILGAIVFAVDPWLANVAGKPLGASGSPYASLGAILTRVRILVLVGAMALLQMGFANEIINLPFCLLLGEIALAINFGIGGRDITAQQLAKWTKSIDSSTPFLSEVNSNVNTMDKENAHHHDSTASQWMRNFETGPAGRKRDC